MVAGSFRYLKKFPRTMWILALGWFIAAAGFASSIPFISIYFHEQLGMSPTQIGLFFGAMAIVRGVFQALGGELYDRAGARGILVNSQLIRALSYLLLAVAIDRDLGFWTVSACLTLNFMSGAVFMSAVTAMISDSLPNEQRLEGFAVSRTASNVGWAVGPALGGYLSAISFASLFYASAAITVIAAVVVGLALDEPGTRPKGEHFHIKDLLDLRKDRRMLVHTSLTFLLYLVVAQLIVSFSLYTVEMAGISKTELGYLFTLNGLLVVLLQIPITRLVSGWRLTEQLTAGALLYFVGYSTLGIFASFWWFAMAMTIVTIGEVTMSPASLTLTSRLAPEGRTGRYMGMYGFFVTAGWSLGPLYGGAILDWLGSQPIVAWVVISALAVVAAIGFTVFGRHLDASLNAPKLTT